MESIKVNRNSFGESRTDDKFELLYFYVVDTAYCGAAPENKKCTYASYDNSRNVLQRGVPFLVIAHDHRGFEIKVQKMSTFQLSSLNVAENIVQRHHDAHCDEPHQLGKSCSSI